MKQFPATGIVLRRTDYGEADRIITVLTAEHGKIRLFAKGVRRAKSKLAGGIELFSISELHLIKGKKDIDTLVSSRLMHHYGNIVKDLDRTELAYKMLKTIEQTLEDSAGQEYFEILNESLAALDNEKIDLRLINASFAMRVLSTLGYIPDFSIGKGGQPLDPDGTYEYDFESSCFVQSDKGPFNKNHLKVLKLLAHNSPQKMAAVQGINQYVDDVEGLIRGLSSYYLPGN